MNLNFNQSAIRCKANSTALCEHSSERGMQLQLSVASQQLCGIIFRQADVSDRNYATKMLLHAADYANKNGLTWTCVVIFVAIWSMMMTTTTRFFVALIGVKFMASHDELQCLLVGRSCFVGWLVACWLFGGFAKSYQIGFSYKNCYSGCSFLVFPQ